MTTCKNCDNSFEGTYCPNCAQKADTHRFTIKHFAHEFFHAFTHADKGIFFLIKELLTRPGQAIREYNEGKRKKYFNPITFLLIASALQIFAIKKTEIFGHYTTATVALTKQFAPASISKEQSDKTMEILKQETDKSMAITLENSKLLTFFFIPVLGLLTWLFFRKRGANYAENLVMNVMISAELSILFLVLCLIPFLILPSYVLLWMTLYLLINWAYSIIVYKQFFRQGWLITIVKGVIIQLAFMLCMQGVMAIYINLMK